MKKVLFTVLVLAAATVSVAAQKAEPRILAHRGGRYEFEENTLSAFKSSLEAGCTGYETDVRMTADGKLVILHNASTLDMTGTDLVIEQSKCAQIKALDTKKGNKIPTMDELMDLLNSQDGLYVEFEMKTDAKAYPQERLEEYCDKVYKAVYSKKKPANSLYILSSFDTRALIYLKSKHPDAVLMLITGEPCCQETINYCKMLGINRMAATLNGTTRAAVQKAHAESIKVNLWPGSIPDDTCLAYYLGADYLCTDIPVQVIDFIKQNGLKINY